MISLLDLPLCGCPLCAIHPDGLCIDHNPHMTEARKKEYNREYRARNRDKLLASLRKYQAANREKARQYAKAYREKNKDAVAAKSVAYREKNRAKLAAGRKNYRSRNTAKINSYMRKYLRERYKNDPNFRRVNRVRREFGIIFGNCRSGKWNPDAHYDLIGCSFTYLREHIENQFTDGMTWEAIPSVIHIDHVRALSKFDLSTPAGCNAAYHYSNLQPLWAIDNLRKHTKSEVPIY